LDRRKRTETDNQFVQNGEHKQKESAELQRIDNCETKRPVSAHVCPRCGTSILIENIGLLEATTGIINCPNCDWSGKIEIRIVQSNATD